MTPILKVALAASAFISLPVLLNAQQVDDLPSSHLTPYGKQTSTENRLLIHVNLQFDFGVYYPYDSTVYNYSGARTSNNKWEQYEAKYDEGLRYRYDYASNAYWLEKKLVQSFDGSNNIVTQLTQKWTPSTSTWRNNILTSNVYSTSNQLISSTTQVWDSLDATWKNQSQITYSYTAANKVSSMLATTWSGSAWQNSRIELYDYDASNKISAKRTETWTSGSWKPYTKENYQYDATNVIEKIIETWDAPTNSWNIYSKRSYSTFVADQPQEEVTQYWSSGMFNNKFRRKMFYNDNGQLTFWGREEWREDLGGVWIGYNSFPAGARYYYGSEVSVPQNARTTNSLSVFPVPAGNELYIYLHNSAAQQVYGVICDLLGKPIISFDIATCETCDRHIDIRSLSAGSWLLQLHTGGEVLNRHFVVLR